jgi:hypothetical protein
VPYYFHGSSRSRIRFWPSKYNYSSPLILCFSKQKLGACFNNLCYFWSSIMHWVNHFLMCRGIICVEFHHLQLYKIMKEHKNPKVLSEGILWMVLAIDDFGVSHLKLKVLLFLPPHNSSLTYWRLSFYSIFYPVVAVI